MSTLYSLVHPDLEGELTRYDIAYPSLATVFVPTETQNSMGQLVRTWTNPLAGHVDMKCRITPLILERPNSNEFRKGSEMGERALNDRQVSFPRHYPLIDTTMKIDVDGVRYDISGVEPDSNRAFTRLRVYRLEPSNAQE